MKLILLLLLLIVLAASKEVVLPHVEEALNREYETCAEAFNDLLRWMVVLYGDWYGNKGGNTLMYYLNVVLTSKVPQWVSLCLT